MMIVLQVMRRNRHNCIAASFLSFTRNRFDAPNDMLSLILSSKIHIIEVRENYEGNKFKQDTAQGNEIHNPLAETFSSNPEHLLNYKSLTMHLVTM